MIKQFNTLFISLLFLTTSLYGQEDYIIDVQHFTQEDGLSHRQANTVHQDTEGFIWIGTRYGLNRFDGHRFKIYSKEKNGMESNEVEGIFEDSEGWLWVHSELKEGKLHYFSFVNIHNDEVQSPEQRFKNNLPFDFKNVTGVASAPNGTIFLSVGQQIWQYRSGQFKAVCQSDRELVINSSNDNQTLTGYRRPPPQSIEPFVFDTKLRFLGTQVPTSLYSPVNGSTDTDGNNWLFEEKNVYLRKQGSNKWKKQSFSSLLKTDRFKLSFLSHIYHDKKASRYWYKDDRHLYLFHPERGVLVDMGNLHPEIIDAHILKIVFDKQGNTWICTNLGVFQIRLSKNPFQNYLHQPKTAYNINTAFSARGIALKNGQLWANSVFDKQYLVDLDDKSYSKLPIPTIHLPDGTVAESTIYRPILKVSENEFYMASRTLVQYINGAPTKLYYWEKSVKPNMIWSIFKNENTIWVGRLDLGLGIVRGDSLTHYNRYNEHGDLAQSSVYHFLKWNDQFIFLATTSGIYALDPQRGIVQRFGSDGDGQTHIPVDNIHHLYQDKSDKDILWAATGGGGILKLKIGGEDRPIIESLEQFTIVDGLSNNVTYAIYEDDYGNLWIPSDYGLIQFNKTSLKSKAYTVFDGLPYNEFNRISHFQADDGRLFFGTMNGVTSFYPKKLLGIEEDFDPPLHITEFKQFNGSENRLEDRTVALNENGRITLQPNDKFLTFAFALLEYKDAHQIKYSYRLKGQSDEWVYLNGNELRLSGLPYGDFTLNVRAQGVSGQFSENRLAIPITVLKPFYLNAWFFILATLGVVAGIIYWSKRRTHNLEMRHAELEQQVAERTATIAAQAEELRSLDKMKSRFFANVSHELRTPLTLLLGPVSILSKESGHTDKSKRLLAVMQKNGARLHRLINEILDLSKLESGKLSLDLQPVNLYRAIHQVVGSFESFAEHQGIQLRLHCEVEKHLQIELDKSKFSTILNNLLSNAFKFTPKGGKVIVSVKNNKGKIHMEVSDTGIGIHPDDLARVFDRFYQASRTNAAAEGGTGIGLAFSREIAHLMKGRLWAESEPDVGSTFFLEFPYVEVLKTLSDEDVLEIKNIDEKSSEKKTAASVPVLLKNNPTKPLLLMVEDSPDLQDYLQMILTPDYEIVAAGNGKEALQYLGETSQLPDLILSDVMMPLMDGFQLLDHLKSSDTYRHIPVVMLTARAGLKDKVHALRIGVDDYLTKPFEEEELLARISNLIKNAANRLPVKMTASSPTDLTSPPPATEPTPNLSATDYEWLAQLEQLLLKHINLFDLNIDMLADEFNISRRQFQRKVRHCTGLSASQYITEIRLNHARTLLENKTCQSVKAASLSVGIKSPSYFSRQFKQRFGKSPADYW